MESEIDSWVFIIQDDTDLCDSIALAMRSHGLQCEILPTPEAVEVRLAEVTMSGVPSCILVNSNALEIDGFNLADRLAERGLLQALPIIFVATQPDVRTAVEAFKHGAFDFIPRPFKNEDLMKQIKRALHTSAQTIEARQARCCLMPFDGYMR